MGFAGVSRVEGFWWLVWRRNQGVQKQQELKGCGADPRNFIQDLCGYSLHGMSISLDMIYIYIQIYTYILTYVDLTVHICDFGLGTEDRRRSGPES